MTASNEVLEAEQRVKPRSLGSTTPLGQDTRVMPVWKAVTRLLCFFLLLLLAMVAVDRLLTLGLWKVTTGNFGVANRIVDGQINSEILISGSSRALSHYDPRIIEQATGRTTFNIGLNGSQTDMQLARLKTYLKHNQPPKLLVQNLDLFSFVTSHEIYDPGQYIPYLKENAIYAGVRRVYPDAWKWKYLPLYGYAVQDMRLDWLNGVRALVGFQPREDEFLGYQPKHTPWTGDFEKFRDANPNGIIIETEPQGVSDFEEILSLCAEQKIPVLVVYSPEYFEMQAIEKNRAEILTKAKEIADRFGATLWDYSSSPLGRVRANFYNSQHLNADGASLFSAEFGKRLIAAGVVNRATSPSITR